MTGITLKEFFAKAAENEELKTKLKELNAKMNSDLKNLAAEYGYELSEATALSDDALDQATGGAKALSASPFHAFDVEF